MYVMILISTIDIAECVCLWVKHQTLGSVYVTVSSYRHQLMPSLKQQDSKTYHSIAVSSGNVVEYTKVKALGMAANTKTVSQDMISNIWRYCLTSGSWSHAVNSASRIWVVDTCVVSTYFFLGVELSGTTLLGSFHAVDSRLCFIMKHTGSSDGLDMGFWAEYTCCRREARDFHGFVLTTPSVETCCGMLLNVSIGSGLDQGRASCLRTVFFAPIPTVLGCAIDLLSRSLVDGEKVLDLHKGSFARLGFGLYSVVTHRLITRLPGPCFEWWTKHNLRR